MKYLWAHTEIDDWKSSVLIAQLNDEIFGLIRCNWQRPPFGKIVELWVQEDVRGKGTGRELMRLFEEECLKRGFHSAIGTLNEHTTARGFYEKLGYVVAYPHECGARERFTRGLVINEFTRL